MATIKITYFPIFIPIFLQLVSSVVEKAKVIFRCSLLFFIIIFTLVVNSIVERDQAEQGHGTSHVRTSCANGTDARICADEKRSNSKIRLVAG